MASWVGVILRPQRKPAIAVSLLFTELMRIQEPKSHYLLTLGGEAPSTQL